MRRVEEKALPERVHIYYKDGTNQLEVMEDIAHTINAVRPDRKVGIYLLREIGTVKTDVTFVPDEQLGRKS